MGLGRDKKRLWTQDFKGWSTKSHFFHLSFSLLFPWSLIQLSSLQLIYNAQFSRQLKTPSLFTFLFHLALICTQCLVPYLSSLCCVLLTFLPFTSTHLYSLWKICAGRPFSLIDSTIWDGSEYRCTGMHNTCGSYLHSELHGKVFWEVWQEISVRTAEERVNSVTENSNWGTPLQRFALAVNSWTVCHLGISSTLSPSLSLFYFPLSSSQDWPSVLVHGSCLCFIRSTLIWVFILLEKQPVFALCLSVLLLHRQLLMTHCSTHTLPVSVFCLYVNDTSLSLPLVLCVLYVYPSPRPLCYKYGFVGIVTHYNITDIFFILIFTS